MINNNDISGIRMHLNELRSQFDQVMRNGDDFNLLRELHIKIKELECHLQALEWNGHTERDQFGFHDDSHRNTNG